MQRISFAPVLSATRSRDSCWITSLLPNLCGDSRAGSVNRLSDTRVRTADGVRRRPSEHGIPGCGAHSLVRGVMRASRPAYSYVSRPRRAASYLHFWLLGLLDDRDQPPPLGGGRG